MSDPSPDKASASGTPSVKARFDLPTEEELQVFWQKNRNFIYAVCIAIILAILGRGIYGKIEAHREAGVRAAFAAAVTPAQLQAFVREHPGHTLAGVAYLKLGDTAYADAHYETARDDYQKAATALKGTPFGARAHLGEGISLIQAGKTTEGSSILESLANDSAQLQAVRSEAAYHLAALAFAQHDYEKVAKLTDQVMQMDSSGLWAQRALILRARLPASATAKGSGSAPAVSLKLPGGK